MLIETNGITLKATPFKDRSKILQLLTQDLGVISVIVNKINKNNLNLINLCSLFTEAELILKKTNSDLYTLHEANITNVNLHLRKDLKFINSASFITKAVLDFHFHEKKSYNIFLLFKSYLKKIHINPEALYLSFLLKLLNIEGLIHLNPNCSNCLEAASAIQNGESFCLNHSLDYSFKFSKDEFEKLLVFCYSKSFSIFENIDVSLEFKEKTQALFNDLI
jgi:DNA repair protein RecO (recombination protein O)